MASGDVPRGKGQCDIRLVANGEVEVSVRGDLIYVRTIQGGNARDDGSECSEPLPSRVAAGFRFEKKEGRGEMRLINEPSQPSDYQAVVRIRSTDSGEAKFHFRISWRIGDATGLTDAGPFDSKNPVGLPDRVEDRREGGGLAWNNTFHSGGRGQGVSTMNGNDSARLTNATVDIDRGGKIFVSFRTGDKRTLTFSGTLMAPEGGALKAQVTAGDRADLRGPMYLSRDAKGDVYRITLDVTNGQDRLHLDWDRR
jgi:hypothetical protein